VVEGIDKAQPLIKELLRFRDLGRDWMMQITQSVHQRHRPGACIMRVLLSWGEEATQRNYKKEAEMFVPFHDIILLGQNPSGRAYNLRPEI
jgi:hypothetical protein